MIDGRGDSSQPSKHCEWNRREWGKQPTVQWLGSLMTTSATLSHDLTDMRIGTGFMSSTCTFLRFLHLGRWAAMTSPASACEEVARVSWALKKDYYCTTEMQSWHAKMAVCVLAGLDYWTYVYAIKLWWHHNQYLTIWLMSCSCKGSQGYYVLWVLCIGNKLLIAMETTFWCT